MLADLTVEHLREEEDDSITPRGTQKHWHIFHIVAPVDHGKPGIDRLRLQARVDDRLGPAVGVLPK